MPNLQKAKKKAKTRHPTYEKAKTRAKTRHPTYAMSMRKVRRSDKRR